MGELSLVKLANKLVKPDVYVDESLWNVILELASRTNYEFTALGFVNHNEEKGYFDIEDIVIPPQRNTHGTTEIKDEEFHQFLQKLREDNYDVSKLKCWLHSHGEHDVYWSDTDNANIARMLNSSNENWLISIVVNKKRDYKIRLDIKNSPLNKGLFNTKNGTLTVDLTHVTLWINSLSEEEKKKCLELYKEKATESFGRIVTGYSSPYAFNKGKWSKWDTGKHHQGWSKWDQSKTTSRKDDDVKILELDDYELMEIYGSWEDDKENLSKLDLSTTTIDKEEDVVYTETYPQGFPYGNTLFNNFDPLSLDELYYLYPFISYADIYTLLETSMDASYDEEWYYRKVAHLLFGVDITKLLHTNEIKENYPTKNDARFLKEYAGAQDYVRHKKPRIANSAIQQIINRAINQRAKAPKELRSSLHIENFYVFTRAAIVNVVSKKKYNKNGVAILLGQQDLSGYLTHTARTDFSKLDKKDPIRKFIYDTALRGLSK
jgi:proteasome lid subunit RPN8/RPN11